MKYKQLSSYIYHSFLCIIITLPCQLSAQVEVDESKKVGVGNAPVENVKLIVKSTEESETIQNTNQFTGDGTTVNVNNIVAREGSGNTFGVYNKINETGSGEKVAVYNDVSQNASTEEYLFGVKNVLTPLGAGRATGVYTKINSGGTNGRIGSHYDMTQGASATGHMRGSYSLLKNYSNKETSGIHNVLNSYGSGKTFGLYNLLNKYGAGERYGVYNIIHQLAESSKQVQGMYSLFYAKGSGIAIGTYNHFKNFGSGSRIGTKNVVQVTSGSKAVTGTESTITHRGSGNSFGSRLIVNGTGTGSKYGVHVNMIDGGEGLRYGVYSVLGENAPEGSYAGYFLGDVYVDGTITEASDESLKENILSLAPSLARLLLLQPKSYNYKRKSEKQIEFGFIAQELEEVFPDLVTKVKRPNSESTKAINYTALIPVLVKSLQEQQDVVGNMYEQLEIQKREIEALQQSIKELQK